MCEHSLLCLALCQLDIVRGLNQSVNQSINQSINHFLQCV